MSQWRRGSTGEFTPGRVLAEPFGIGWAQFRRGSLSSLPLAAPVDSPPSFVAPVAPSPAAWNASWPAVCRARLKFWGGAGLCFFAMPGIYEAQAMEAKEPLADPPTTSSSGEVDPSSQVATWRAAFCLQDDGDFAYAFRSYANALDMAGRNVAEAWARARAAVELNSPDVGLVHAAAGAARPTTDCAVFQACTSVKAKGGGRQTPGRAESSQAQETPGRGCVRAGGGDLANFFVASGAFRPAGALTPARDSLCLRVAAQKCQAAEEATVKRALTTLAELKQFQILRGRVDGLADLDLVDLDAFLQSGTQAPGRAIQSLRWFNGAASLVWPVSQLVYEPRPQSSRKPSGQAIPAEPAMLTLLDDRIETVNLVGDARWSALLGQWLVAVGVVRFAHVKRSCCLRISESTMHCMCPRGKQRRLRGGFLWSVPARFGSGWDWSAAWQAAWEALPPSRRSGAGMAFDQEGYPWSMASSVAATQDEMVSVTADVEKLTSYSWRRVMPSAGVLLRLTPRELNALGDWVDKAGLEGAEKMPVHYAATKYHESVRIKHLVYAAMLEMRHKATWNDVVQEDVDAALQYAPFAATEALRQEPR